MGRLFKHLKLARDFDLLATGLISTSIIAETAVQNTVKKALTAEASSKFAEAVKEYLRRMEHAGQMAWGSHTDFIVENIRQLKLAAGRLTGQARAEEVMEKLRAEHKKLEGEKGESEHFEGILAAALA